MNHMKDLPDASRVSATFVSWMFAGAVVCGGIGLLYAAARTGYGLDRVAVRHG